MYYVTYYRDTDHTLLYVDTTTDPDEHHQQHATAPWMDFADTRTDEEHDTRRSAQMQKDHMVRHVRPLFNRWVDQKAQDRRLVDYLIDREWARSAEDILWRRTKLGLRLTAEQVHALTRHVKAHRHGLAA